MIDADFCFTLTLIFAVRNKSRQSACCRRDFGARKDKRPATFPMRVAHQKLELSGLPQKNLL
jgi:hypothetical protein